MTTLRLYSLENVNGVVVSSDISSPQTGGMTLLLSSTSVVRCINLYILLL